MRSVLRRTLQSTWLVTQQLRIGRETARLAAMAQKTSQFYKEAVAGPDDKPEKIIKPLNLDYAEASKIIDHGGQWVVRINALKKRQLLPAQVLFAVNGPVDATARGKARREVVEELEEAGVIVAPYNQAQVVIDFAKR